MLVFRIIKNNSPIALGRERTSKMNKPVSFGIPFGKGEVYSEDILQLTSTDNEKIPIDTWPLAYWPDGSIKWNGIAGVIPVGMKIWLLKNKERR